MLQVEYSQRKNLYKKIKDFFEIDIWQISESTLPTYKVYGLRTLKVLILSAKGFQKDHCTLKASALTFLSALSTVPLIIMAFAISQGFGFDIKREISTLLRGQEAVMGKVFIYADTMLHKTRGDLIAGVGLLVLFYTVMRLLHNIEDIFNSIWAIRRHRSLQRKFADYTAVLLVSPMLVFFSSSLNVFITAQIKSLTLEFDVLDYISPLLFTLVRLLPLTLLWLLLALLYIIMPNTRVRLKSAVFAAIFAGTILQMTQWMYINFQVNVSSYNAIYGSLAALPLFFTWLQISWIIALYGAELAFAHQHIDNYGYMNDDPLSPREKKYVALLVVRHVALRFKQGEPSTAHTIASDTHLPRGVVVDIIQELQAAKLLCELLPENNELRYQPSIDIHLITPKFVIERMETVGFNGTALGYQGEEALRLQSILSSSEKHMNQPLVDI